MMRPILLVLTTASLAMGFPYFQSQIPNGDHIPHPCDKTKNWPGVGHENDQGSGPRNPFGLDFYNENKMWTVSLCQKDSDGDGMSNGQELGDPNCVWSSGRQPEKTTMLSHPGVCEPITSTVCIAKNTFLKCSSTRTTDSALVNNATNRFTTEPSMTRFDNATRTPAEPGLVTTAAGNNHTTRRAQTNTNETNTTATPSLAFPTEASGNNTTPFMFPNDVTTTSTFGFPNGPNADTTNTTSFGFPTKTTATNKTPNAFQTEVSNNSTTQFPLPAEATRQAGPATFVPPASEATTTGFGLPTQSTKATTRSVAPEITAEATTMVSPTTSSMNRPGETTTPKSGASSLHIIHGMLLSVIYPVIFSLFV